MASFDEKIYEQVSKLYRSSSASAIYLKDFWLLNVIFLGVILLLNIIIVITFG